MRTVTQYVKSILDEIKFHHKLVPIDIKIYHEKMLNFT